MATKHDEPVQRSRAEDFLTLLSLMTQDDLDKLDADIAEAEKALDAKKATRKLVAMKLGVVVASKPGPRSRGKAVKTTSDASPTKSAPSEGSIAYKVLQHVFTHGNDSVTAISTAIAVPYQSLYTTISSNSQWFNKDNGKVSLTVPGHQLAKELFKK